MNYKVILLFRLELLFLGDEYTGIVTVEPLQNEIEQVLNVNDLWSVDTRVLLLQADKHSDGRSRQTCENNYKQCNKISKYSNTTEYHQKGTFMKVAEDVFVVKDVEPCYLNISWTKLYVCVCQLRWLCRIIFIFWHVNQDILVMFHYFQYRSQC